MNEKITKIAFGFVASVASWLRRKMVFCYQNCSDFTVRKNCSTDRENLLKFEGEGQEFAKVLRSPEEFIQAVKGQNNFW